MISVLKEVKLLPCLVILPEEFQNIHEETLNNDIVNTVNAYKCCNTRHGCSGATNCDNAYGDYHR